MLYYTLVNETKTIRIPIPAFACIHSPIHERLTKAEPRILQVLEYEKQCDASTLHIFSSQSTVTVLSAPSTSSFYGPGDKRMFTASGLNVIFSSAEAMKEVVERAKKAKSEWTDPVPDFDLKEALEYEVPDMSDGFAAMLRAILWPRFIASKYYTYEAASYFDQQLLYSFFSPFGNHCGDFTKAHVTMADLNKWQLTPLLQGLQAQYLHHEESLRWHQSRYTFEGTERKHEPGFWGIPPKATTASAESSNVTTSTSADEKSIDTLVRELHPEFYVTSERSPLNFSFNLKEEVVLETEIASFKLLEHPFHPDGFMPNLAITLATLLRLGINCHYYVTEAVTSTLFRMPKGRVPNICCPDIHVDYLNAPPVIQEWAKKFGIIYCGCKYDNQFSQVLSAAMRPPRLFVQ